MCNDVVHVSTSWTVETIPKAYLSLSVQGAFHSFSRSTPATIVHTRATCTSAYPHASPQHLPSCCAQHTHLLSAFSTLTEFLQEPDSARRVPDFSELARLPGGSVMLMRKSRSSGKHTTMSSSSPSSSPSSVRKRSPPRRSPEVRMREASLAADPPYAAWISCISGEREESTFIWWRVVGPLEER